MNLMNLIKITRYPKGFQPLCTSCGQCCTKINVAIDNLKKLFTERNIPIEEIDYHFKWNKSGKCEKLDKDGKCKVYDKRPNVCRIDWVNKKLGIPPSIFIPMVIKGCNQLMDENDVPKEFRIVE